MTAHHLFCKKCNFKISPRFEQGPFGPHEAKLVCPLCDSFLQWVVKEKNKGKRPKNKYTAESLGISFCQLCMRQKERLGSYETLVTHHIIEIQDGGEDIPGNIWVVCTHCHVLIHHQRIYLNDHQAAFYEKYENIKRVLSNSLESKDYEEAMSQIVGILGI